MCTWDLIDGQCIESVKLYQIHSHIQVIGYKIKRKLTVNFGINSHILLEELKMHPFFVLGIIQRSLSLTRLH